MSADLSVRTAVREDAYALWIWANDPTTRVASHGRDVVAWEDHVAWLDARLRDPGALVLVGTVGDARPVGSVRFDTRDAWMTARLSYVVAPEARGAGFGGALVRTGVGRLRDAHPRVEVVAEVMRENEPSLRVFRALGWAEREGEGSLRFHDVPRP